MWIELKFSLITHMRNSLTQSLLRSFRKPSSKITMVPKVLVVLTSKGLMSKKEVHELNKSELAEIKPTGWYLVRYFLKIRGRIYVLTRNLLSPNLPGPSTPLLGKTRMERN